MEKRLTNELPFCRLGPLMKIIEQANRPHSSVEWHFACSMNCTKDDVETLTESSGLRMVGFVEEKR